MRTDTLDYTLPSRLIALEPAEPRDASRLMVVRTSGSGKIDHRTFRDLPDLLSPDDMLVFNSSRVVPARFVAVNLETGGKAEGIWIRTVDATSEAALGETYWDVMIRAKRARPGRKLGVIAPGQTEPGDVMLTLIEPVEAEPGTWRVKVDAKGDPGRVLDRVGRPPLPPYILSTRRSIGRDAESAHDPQRYQTVYAEKAGGAQEHGASIAAPTAGLHFSEGLLGALDADGVKRVEVSLHVGAGTFKPVEAEDLESHVMHKEWCSLNGQSASIFDSDRRLIAVGTTSMRTVETFAHRKAEGLSLNDWVETDLFIKPDSPILRTQGLITNFHLPRSTLLALVAAMLPGGVEQVKACYEEAIREKYRFYSYGDAMLILP